ncbi:MBL fold metallo-hydrolase [Streptosporangium sp. NPDC087985]|uniref:MBL fold metallo-hydrolase n=1 Tax=Streptosporangium sp. NPDC087985 TaxID=3366196 RepID=UPI00380683B8
MTQRLENPEVGAPASTTAVAPWETRESWTRPGAHELAAGVFRIPLPLPMDGLKAVNVYAVVSAEGVTLIDGGWAILEAEEQLTRAMDEIGCGIDAVTDVLVTHAHRDHYTLAVTLRRKWGSRISIGIGERTSMEDLAVRPEFSVPRQVEQLRRAGAAQLAEAMRDLDNPFDNSHWTLPDNWLDSGTVIKLDDERQLEAIHTPGHTAGHMVFIDRRHGLVFSGDHVLPHITPSVGFEQVPTSSPLSDYLSSLALLRDLPDGRLLPAHGPSMTSVHARVDELLEHHARRLDLTCRALAAGASTAYEVAQKLKWTGRARMLTELDPFNQSLATLETAAHLDVLVERGLVRREENGQDVATYAI